MTTQETGIRHPTLRLFNPGLCQSDREVIDQFVVRRHQFDFVLEVLRDNLASASCQHVLLTGARGMGKTMLLARLEAELRTDPALLPVRLPEDSHHEIADATAFWLEALYGLATACQRRHPDTAAELEAAHASLCRRWREPHLQPAALAALERGLAAVNRRMVLMAENLEALTESWDPDNEWRLRKILQEADSMFMLVGTASRRRFAAIDDLDRAWFGLFREIDLPPLTTGECAVLWHMVTGRTVAARTVRFFETLTGGNPRLLAMLAADRPDPDPERLWEHAVDLLDRNAEYCRGSLGALPRGERRVLLALAELWEPASASATAKRARMDVRVVSVMLGRLANRGLAGASGDGRARRWSIGNRIMGLHYSLQRERDPEVLRRRIQAGRDN